MAEFTFEEAMGLPPAPSTPANNGWDVASVAPAPNNSKEFTFEEAMGLPPAKKQQYPAKPTNALAALNKHNPATEYSLEEVMGKPAPAYDYSEGPATAEQANYPKVDISGTGGNDSVDHQWDVVSTEPAPSQDGPAATNNPLSSELLRQLGLTGRAGIEGVTKAISYPVNAVGEAVGGVAGALGYDALANDIKSSVGVSGGAKAASMIADSMGLPKPKNKLESVIQAGAQMMAGGVVGNPMSNASPLLQATLPATATAKGLVTNATIGSALEASPELAIGTGGALLAASVVKKGGAAVARGVDSHLQSKVSDKLFKGNRNAAIDAEIITDLARQKSYNGGALGASDVTALSKQYLKDARSKLSAAGVSSDDARMAFSSSGAIVNLDSQVIKRLEATTEGKTVLAAIDKANRVKQLAPAADNKTGVLSGILSGGADAVLSAVTGLPAPVATLARSGTRMIRNARGGSPDTATLTSARSQKAANDYLVVNGPSEARKGLDMLDQKAAAKATKTAVTTATDQASLDALKLKARKVSSTPGGGAYQALLEHTGLTSDDLNTALRIAEKVPEAASAVKAIRVNGSNTSDGAIYPLTDIVKSIGKRMGMASKLDGALAGKPLGSGVLSEAGILTDNAGKSVRSPSLYAAKTSATQGQYLKDIATLNAGSLPKNTKADALDVMVTVQRNGNATARQEAIDGLIAKHPGQAVALLKTFKQYSSK